MASQRQQPSGGEDLSILEQIRRSFEWLAQPHAQNEHANATVTENTGRSPAREVGCLPTIIQQPGSSGGGFTFSTASSRQRAGAESPAGRQSTGPTRPGSGRSRRRESRGAPSYRSKSRRSALEREEEFKKKAIQISGELNALATQLTEDHVLNPKRLNTIWAQSRILHMSYNSMSTSGSGVFPFGLKGALGSSMAFSGGAHSTSVSLELPRGAPTSAYTIGPIPQAAPVSPDSSVNLQSATASPAALAASPGRPSGPVSAHSISGLRAEASPASVRGGASSARPSSGKPPAGPAAAKTPSPGREHGRPSRVMVASAKRPSAAAGAAAGRASERLREMEEQLHKEREAVRILMARLQEEMKAREEVETKANVSQEQLGRKDLVLARVGPAPTAGACT
eukprot:tig00000144_g9081.t1